MTLDVGPGINVQPHFDQPVVRLDRRLDANPTTVADVRALPFRDGTFSTVYASHVLEHFSKNEAFSLLSEWWRPVAGGGELQVFVPNLEWCALQIVNGICDDFVLNALYGRQENHLDKHFTGFTPGILRQLLQSLPGVKTIEIRTFRNSICAWVKKICA